VHWLVVNIPGDSKDISKGETLIEFVPSCPGQGSGVHRYTFVLYEQPSHQDFSAVQKFDKSVEHRVLRRNFSIRRFARMFSMEEAHSGNFYTTEWDEYVTVIRKQLGLE
jgi:phosphatidylethanolamine-binding protein